MLFQICKILPWNYASNNYYINFKLKKYWFCDCKIFLSFPESCWQKRSKGRKGIDYLHSSPETFLLLRAANATCVVCLFLRAKLAFCSKAGRLFVVCNKVLSAGPPNAADKRYALEALCKKWRRCQAKQYFCRITTVGVLLLLHKSQRLDAWVLLSAAVRWGNAVWLDGAKRVQPGRRSDQNCCRVHWEPRSHQAVFGQFHSQATVAGHRSCNAPQGIAKGFYVDREKIKKLLWDASEQF